MFQGFPEETVKFFLDVRFHNNTSWYAENKDRYYSDVRCHFYDMIEALAPHMLSIDHQMEVRPFKCLSRLRRDVRFTKDKSPFRDHLWFCFHRAGEPRDGTDMFWFELSPECATYGMGFWSENKLVNEKMRRFIAANPDYFLQLLKNADLDRHGLTAEGSVYKRIDIPDGISDELKPFYARRDPIFLKTTNDMSLIQSSGLLDEVLSCFNALAPLYKFYRGYIDEAILDQAEMANEKNDIAAQQEKTVKIIEEW